jgi:hypothetical protein
LTMRYFSSPQKVGRENEEDPRPRSNRSLSLEELQRIPHMAYF